jgi:hypothetical protein
MIALKLMKKRCGTVVPKKAPSMLPCLWERGK